ncbi:MAG: GntR family transcriptional regulator [Lachnospiraceae bacterium]|nr:GntR family transcriptional regulator [Lachnospiraceae bacterium]
MAIKRAVSLKTQVYQLIKNSILNHEIKQNMIYSEQWFADTFEVSRTPVREALLQLRAEDLIEVLPNRGVIVKAITLSDARAIFQMRIAIEGYCGMYLAKRVNEKKGKATLDRVENLLEECHRQFNRMQEMQFHTEIIEFTGNQEFLAQYNRMKAKIEVFWTEVVGCRNRTEEAYIEHKKIFDCIKAGDAFGAFLTSEEHLEITFQRIRDSDLFKHHDEKPFENSNN